MKHFGSTSGLTALVEDQATPANGMVAYITSSYNSGYQNGDIKGAYLADTDTADLVGGTAIDDGSSATGWSDARSNGTVTSTGGRIRSTATAAGAYGPVKTLTGLVSGREYVYSADVFTAGGGGLFYFRINAAPNLNDTQPVNVSSTSDFSPTATFVATNSTMYVGVIHVAAAGGDYAEIDNISVQLVDADRSVNNNGLIVNGTVTRSPVADGAELVAYSGFNSSNYLEQPYNSDLDFGTGDFCVMGWVYNAAWPNNAEPTPFYRGSDFYGAGENIFIQISSGKPNVLLGRSASKETVIANSTLANAAWSHVALVRFGSTVSWYINGEFDASGTSARNLTNANAELRIGVWNNAGAPGSGNFGSKAALLRISATAPTAEQIAKIYADELALFQPNAACTLYGASDAVTALAHDPDTDLLHVGTSSGRSVFEGLRRVGNTTTSVTKSISASGGLIVEK